MSGYELPYGYQDFSSASAEAYQHSWDAYNAGNMEAANYWSSVSQSDSSISNDLYYGNVDPYGTESPATSVGYYPGDYTGGYDTGTATPAMDTAGWSSSTFDSGASCSVISNGDMSSVL
jgi:hypothetical protein